MGWYVVETEIRAETLAQDEIETGLGLHTFLPKMRREVRSRAELRHRRDPPNPYVLILPRYLFVQFDLAADKLVWPAIKRQRGVRTILGLRPGGLRSEERSYPMAVRDADFARLQELAAELSAAPLPDNGRPTPLPPETVVRVLWGPMAGQAGEILFDNGIRADVLLASAGVASKISLPRELIESL